MKYHSLAVTAVGMAHGTRTLARSRPRPLKLAVHDQGEPEAEHDLELTVTMVKKERDPHRCPRTASAVVPGGQCARRRSAAAARACSCRHPAKPPSTNKPALRVESGVLLEGHPHRADDGIPDDDDEQEDVGAISIQARRPGADRWRPARGPRVSSATLLQRRLSVPVWVDMVPPLVSNLSLAPGGGGGQEPAAPYMRSFWDGAGGAAGGSASAGPVDGGRHVLHRVRRTDLLTLERGVRVVLDRLGDGRVERRDGARHRVLDRGLQRRAGTGSP